MRLAARWGATAALLVIAALGSVVAGATPRVWADMPDMEVLDAYRLAAREKTSLLREQAGVDALRIACATGGTVLFLFLAGSAGCYRMGARSSQSLHDFTLRHHQDADSIDVSTGAKERLDTVHNRHHDDGEEGYSPVTGSTLLNSSSYSAFRDTSNASNGKTKDVLEMRTVVEKRRRLGRLGRVKHVKSTVEQAFAEMDQDESGSLDRSEIRSLLANPLLTHRILTDEEIDAIMLKIDPNEDGDVTKKEFAAFWESADADGLRQASRRRRFKRNNRDQDGHGHSFGHEEHPNPRSPRHKPVFSNGGSAVKHAGKVAGKVGEVGGKAGQIVHRSPPRGPRTSNSDIVSELVVAEDTFEVEERPNYTPPKSADRNGAFTAEQEHADT